MSLLPTCSVCDALIRVSGETRCSRCNQDCPDCGGVIGFCSHDLPDRLTDKVHDELSFTVEMMKRKYAA